VLPLTIAFARIFASVFERAFLRHHPAPAESRLRLPRAEGVPG
jgi:hypothetical protein